MTDLPALSNRVIAGTTLLLLLVFAMTLLGVGANQVEAVSFGKERPAVQGSGEEAWAKNRRVELKDK